MKEQSFEEKAKAYDEALERARQINDEHRAQCADVMVKVFPELKESEDEKIVTEIKYAVNCAYGNSSKSDRIFAWLEKQGEQEKLNTYIDKLASETIYNDENGNPIDKDLMAFASKVAFSMIPATKTESYHDLNRSRISDAVIKGAQWRKEQSEQKPYTSETMNEKGDFDNGFTRMMEKEQKPADKIGPKFKVGDWVVNNKTLNLCHILKVKHGQYICDDCSFPITKENEYHLWTIQDAKDGDVLSYRDGQWCFIYKGIVTEDTFKYYALLSKKGITINDAAFSLLSSCIIPATKEQRDILMNAMANAGYTFDFEKKELKKIEQKPTFSEDNLSEFESYLCLMFQKFRTKGMCTNGEIIEYVKEHSQKLRDILVKPAWSEEDEKKLLCICAWIKDYPRIADFKDEMYTVANNYIDWLKSLRPQPKNEWNKNDELNKQDTIRLLTDAKERYLQTDASIPKCIKWLESLSPQKQWKPSDEQMEALEHFIVYHNGSTNYAKDLEELRLQLKKLKEE